MSNNVFANGREINCKKGSGKSICAFPDVCWTPPDKVPPTPTGVPVPYPNTGMASDCTKGSKKVKVSGKEVLLKNSSHFKKSMGDEAGVAQLKGMMTMKNRGKIYFQMWSMDVKVEGKNVVRHLDVGTHNHGSYPGNSPPWPFLDSAAFDDSGHPCNETAKQVKEKCERYIKLKKGKTDVNAENIHGRGRKASIEAMCEDKDGTGCREARACILSPENPSNCCGTQTPHHLIPAHCFMGKNQRGSTNEVVFSGCEGYKSKDAPCICVSGASKTEEHGELHDLYDATEDLYLDDGKAGSWSYNEAHAAALDAVEDCDAVNCDSECIGAQLDSYHTGPKPGPSLTRDTPLRADSSGQHTSDSFTPSESTPSDIF